ncbi:hypothetical protein AB0M28_16020 [Streptomyces sp. NPDC051940]|uniref:COG1470 family protein n=1 Tax=Streptomyces sp. NPDC051940 TaxID=3155675 RepID=UPI0034414206
MQYRTRRARWPAAAALAVLACLGTAPAAGADEARDGWSAGPLGGRPFFYLEGAPGTVLKDTVAVTNPGATDRRVTLRGADAYNRGDGSFALRAGGRTGAWLGFAERELKIPARTRAEIPFTVAVPEGAVPGDHPAAIVVRSGGRDLGIRVHLRVTGPSLAAVGIEDVRVRDGRLSYALVNRGSTVLAPRLAVRAAGYYGDVLRHGPRDLGVELLPGQRVTLSEPWPGTSALDSVDIRLTVTAPGGARATARAGYASVPWGRAAAGAALAAGAAAAVRWLRRRRRTAHPSAPPDVAGPPAPARSDDCQLTEVAT